MNAHVDVLAVLSDAGQVLERDGYAAIPYDVALAHDAVAELIEAADGAADCLGPTVVPVPKKVRELALLRLRAAVARCEGEQS